MSLFGAGWTLAALKYLAESGVQSVTLYETVGWRGVMEREEGSPLPDVFRSVPGGVFPLYHVLADWGEFRGGEVVVSTSSDPLRVEGAVLRKGDRVRVMMANMTHESQAVTVEGVPRGATVRSLDATTADEAVRSPEAFRGRPGRELSAAGDVAEITLPPYAVVTIDGIP